MIEASTEFSISQSATSNRQIKVLLIEDDIVEARLIQEILENCDINQFGLTHVKRLQTGLYRLRQAQFKLIF